MGVALISVGVIVVYVALGLVLFRWVAKHDSETFKDIDAGTLGFLLTAFVALWPCFMLIGGIGILGKKLIKVVAK